MRARAPLEMPGTSGPQARAQGASRASRCPAPVAAVMTENSDKVPIALVGPDDVEFCSPPVSTARGPPDLRGPGPPGPGSTICVSPNLGGGGKFRSPDVGLGCRPTRVRVQRPGHPQMRAKKVDRERGGVVLEGRPPR